MVIGLKFQILEEEGLYYLCSKNKGDDQRRDTGQLNCTFVLEYAKYRFPHDAAHLMTLY